ncbi:MAG: hypothetical protein E7680_05500 [Ruminococcaceae bacterium]|nr:hypothetical protein [Oscillospiraceae bacterium]
MAKRSKIKEPAKISYFFGESYSDLWHTIRTSWKKNIAKIKEAAIQLKKSWSKRNIYRSICLTFLKVAILASISVFGTLFTAIFSLIHIVLLFILMTAVYLGFVLLRGMDTIYLLLKGITTNCYNPGCERKFTLPIYICPSCQALHYRLVPSKYGIFKRTCNCGAKLPTTFFNGRQKLDSLCPHCQSPAIKGVHKSLLIPVVGGANSGKTCFINTAIDQIEKKAPTLGLKYQYQPVPGDAYEENIKRLNSGVFPQKTGDLSFKYYNFYLATKETKVSNLISVCDIAGEIFTNQDSMTKQQGYRFADGLIVVIDPLSIAEFNQELKKTLSDSDYASLNGSTQLIGDVLSGLINTMESLYHIKAKDTIKKTLAIVFSKCDIPTLKDKLGDAAIRQYMKNNSVDYCNASNALCEQFLLEYGESSFINTVKSKFSEIQYFTCSATGSNSGAGKFDPIDVEKPLLWMIGKMNKSIVLPDIWK